MPGPPLFFFFPLYFHSIIQDHNPPECELTAVYSKTLTDLLDGLLKDAGIGRKESEKLFRDRFIANLDDLSFLFHDIYKDTQGSQVHFQELLQQVIRSFKERSENLKLRDEEKASKGKWFLSNDLAGMSLYVDRFSGHLLNLPQRLEYLENLGINLVHLMPIFESPEGESDGGYAVSDFRKVDARFGTLNDLKAVQEELQQRGMYLMIDIVLNHTSHHHEWARKAKLGDPGYQNYYYFYQDRTVPDLMEQTLPEIFPESSPGNFTFVPELNQWVMSVFHSYQWDLNYRNPMVLVEMLGNIFFYANLGVDVLRIDAPAFIWKQQGTSCQNLPEAHKLLQLIKLCVEIATPGMALLGEAIVAPAYIMEYFGTGRYVTHECDFAYNATHMALQWDALATGDTRVMLAAQHELLRKPLGTTWLTYTRCHDDIGLGYDDYMIENAGLNPYLHRTYLKDYFSGARAESPAKGALFGVNPKTNDARISGSLASLCGLEMALEAGDEDAKQLSLKKILLMQAHSFFLGGVPMLFYGDEAAYLNDYSYLNDPGKSYDNRWMHRPVIDWNRNELTGASGTPENAIYEGTKRLLKLRKNLPVVADLKNLHWLPSRNGAVAGYLRHSDTEDLYCLFNFSQFPQHLTYFVFGEAVERPVLLTDLWTQQTIKLGRDDEYLHFEPYQFYLLSTRKPLHKPL